MKVKITRTPAEQEIDGIDLTRFTLGSICEVSPTTAAWLIAEGYAVPEMRKVSSEEDRYHSLGHERRNVTNDRRRKR